MNASYMVCSVYYGDDEYTKNVGVVCVNGVCQWFEHVIKLMCLSDCVHMEFNINSVYC